MAPVVAAHHVHAAEFDERDYAELEYQHHEEHRAQTVASYPDEDDVPDLSHSPDVSADDSYGSA